MALIPTKIPDGIYITHFIPSCITSKITECLHCCHPSKSPNHSIPLSCCATSLEFPTEIIPTKLITPIQKRVVCDAPDYSTAVHCQMTRYSQRVPGYLTRYSVSSNEISFDKKISQWDCVFQIRLGLQENDSPLHLVTSSGFLKA